MSNEETPQVPSSEPRMLTGKSYDTLKQVVQLWTPAVSTLYFTLGAIWGLPAVEKVIGTLAALATFGGVILGISSKRYDASDARFAGDIVVYDKPEGGKVFSLELNGAPEELVGQKTVTFKIAEPGQ